jgi:hypothetical protein
MANNQYEDKESKEEDTGDEWFADPEGGVGHSAAEEQGNQFFDEIITSMSGVEFDLKTYNTRRKKSPPKSLSHILQTPRPNRLSG